jgi:hypothetical protein
MSHPAHVLSASTSPIVLFIRAQASGEARGAQTLCTLWRHHAARVAGRYPAAWFPQLVKDEGALLELGDELTARCATRPLRRSPYRGRTPFLCFDEEDMEDRPILRLTFYGRFSLLRLRLADHHRANLRRHPGLAADAHRFGEIVRALGVCAVPASRAGLGERQWRPREPGLALALDEARVLARLRALSEASLDALVEVALRALTIATARQLHALLLAVRPLPCAQPPDPRTGRDADLEGVITLRRALSELWGELDPSERALLVWLALGRSSTELSRLDPTRFPNRMAVHRAATRLTARLTQRVTRALGATGQAADDATLGELIVEALLGLPALAPVMELIERAEEAHEASAERLFNVVRALPRSGAACEE